MMAFCSHAKIGPKADIWSGHHFHMHAHAASHPHTHMASRLNSFATRLGRRPEREPRTRHNSLSGALKRRLVQHMLH